MFTNISLYCPSKNPVEFSNYSNALENVHFLSPPCKVFSKLHDMSVISEGSGLAGSKNDFVGSANF